MTDQSPEPVHETPTTTKDGNEKEPRSAEYIAVLSSAIALGVLIVALGSLTFTLFHSLKDDVNALEMAVSADRRAFQAGMDAFRAEAAADRRAFEARMDEFRSEILRLSERQSHLEGTQEAQASASTAGS